MKSLRPGSAACRSLGAIPTSSIHGRENLTAAENATLDDVVDKHDPAKSRGNIMRTADFIARWTNQEYLKLEQKRASDIAAGKIGNAKNWDVVVAEDYIDMNKKKFQNLKADLVADGILTPARADAIFDTPTVAT